MCHVYNIALLYFYSEALHKKCDYFLVDFQQVTSMDLINLPQFTENYRHRHPQKRAIGT